MEGLFFVLLGPAASKAGRRYAMPLASLLGPAAARGGLGLALWATAAQRWAAHLLYFCYYLFALALLALPLNGIPRCARHLLL